MSSSPKAGPESYWTEFEVAEDDLEFIYNLLLEREIPLTSLQMIEPLVRHRLETRAREAELAAAPDVPAYTPAGAYEIGQQLLFEGQVGKVTAVRQGLNPGLPSFDVIQVDFTGGSEPKEYAARLEEHLLNAVPEQAPEPDDLSDSEAVLEQHSLALMKRLESRLEQTEDIVRIAGRWFHAGLLAGINEGHLNLAEAALDVAAGGPLPTEELMQHIETPPGLDPLLTEFSVDFALQEDERFDEVGPEGKVLWFLKRLEPREVLSTPGRLQSRARAYDRDSLSEELRTLEQQIDDELSDVEWAQERALDEVPIPLLYPHWQVGSLPLSSKLSPLFPTAYEAPRIRFILVDGQSGDKFAGWVVRQDRYVYGLKEWYRAHNVPPGGMIVVRRGEAEGEVIVKAADPRSRNDWIRTAAISDDGRIGFTMLKHPVGCAYDDRMIVGVIDEAALEEAWEKGEQSPLPIDRMVPEVFRELSKLNPQDTVHAQQLYSGVNVIGRYPPGPIFAELVTQPYFEHVGDHYWRLDASKWRGE